MIDNLSRTKTAQSLFWRGISTVLQFVVAIFVSILLMRYIGPSDYGIIAKLILTTSLLSVFLDLGLSQGLIQQKTINDRILNSHFSFGVVISCVIAIVLFGGSNLIADFFREPQLIIPLRWMAFSFVAGGSILVHRSMMHRKMQFNRIAIIEIISVGTSAIVAIFLALRAYGYVAIVVQLVLNQFFQTILYWFLSDFRPKVKLYLNDILDTSKFSIFVFLSELVQYFANLLDQFLVALFYAQSILGVYNRSITLVRNPVKLIPSTIDVVLFPLFSRLQEVDQKEPAIYNLYYRSLAIISFIFFPLLFIFFLFTNTIVISLLGVEWAEMIPYASIIALTAFIYISNIESTLYLSLGKSKILLKINLFHRLLTIIAICIGINYTLETLLWCMLISEIISRITILFFTKKTLRINLLKYCKSLWIPWLTSAIPTFIISQFISSTFRDLLIVLSCYILIIGISIYFRLSKPASDIYSIIKELKASRL